MCHRLRLPRLLGIRLAGLALACTAAPLHAQLIQLQVGAGELATEIRSDRRGYAGGSSMRESSFREWLRIPITGSLPRPQLFSYTFVVRPLLGQQNGSGLARQFSSQGLGLDLSVSLLQGKFGGVNLFSTRHEGSADGGLGGESFYATRSRGATMRLATRLLPITLDVNERQSNDMWRGAFDDTPLERRERVQTARFSAAGRKTTLHLERLQFDDRLGATSFGSLTGAFNHRLQWGKGSLLETTFELSDRDGYDPFKRQSWTERLRLQHTKATSTNWYVQRRSSVTYGIPSTGSGSGASLQHDIGRHLGVSVQATTSSSQFPSGASHNRSLLPRVNYRRLQGRSTWISASASTGVEAVRRDVSAGTFVDALEERHRVEPVRQFQLDRINVDQMSIIVRSADMTVTYRSPEDYRLVILGPVVRLQFPVGSRIATGDLVVVTYRYEVLSRNPYRVYSSSLEAGISNRSFSFRHNVNARQIGGGETSAIATPEAGVDEATTLSISRTARMGQLTLEFERRRRSGSTADYAVRESRLLMIPIASRTINTSFGGTVSQTTTAGSGIGVISGNAALSWVPRAGFRLQSSLDTWRWKLSDAPPEQFTGISTQVNWQWGQLETEWRYGYQLRDQSARGIEQRLWARVVRRF